jgi:glycosyltransferase involved in cell wall biosynthesis
MPSTSPVPGADHRAVAPRITVVTPCYNAGRFLEACISSVLDDGYADLEYMVIDGGSTDDTLEIIRKYETRLAYWHSRPDRGQAHAINTGLGRATGEVVAYLNADDRYCPGTLHTVARLFSDRPAVNVVFGDAVFTDEAGQPTSRYVGIDQPFAEKIRYWRGWPVPQPSVFLRRGVVQTHGGLDESFHYALDYDWFLRISRTERFHHAGAVLAEYRLRGDSKTGDWLQNREKFYRECARAVRKYVHPSSALYWFWWISYLGDTARPPRGWRRRLRRRAAAASRRAGAMWR